MDIKSFDYIENAIHRLNELVLLCRESEDANGTVTLLLQTQILDEMRDLCKANYTADKFSDDLSKALADHIYAALQYVQDKSISSAKGINQYQKLSLFRRKYGEDILDEADLIKAKFIYNGATLLNLHAKTILTIGVLEIRDDILAIDGLVRLSSLEKPYRMIAEDQKGNEYEVVLTPYNRADITGCMGEILADGTIYSVKIPVYGLKKLTFYTVIDGQKVVLRPSFDKYIGLGKGHESEYIIKGDYIVSTEAGCILIKTDTAITRSLAEHRYSKEMVKSEGAAWKGERKRQLRHKHYVENAALQDRVAFITTRSEDKLIDNMSMVYDALDLPKVMFAKTRLAKVSEYAEEAEKLVSTSKVVVTDNYLSAMRDLEKKPGQKYVQLWHSTGFAKHFGQDGSDIFPPKDALFHRNYDLVIASSDGVRYTYASAFALPVERIEATGIPRTDLFFDKAYSQEARRKVLKTYPEFEGKQLILYAPTFRDIPGIPRARFVPELDFQRLSQVLRRDQIFAVCPHPLMTEAVVPENYDNIIEVRDISTAELMFEADILITDYSSVMFDYSLLHRPMAFFCYDYDSYDRDFYMDFEKELPGPLLKNQEELFEYLKLDEYPVLEDFDSFYKKNLGACDGHSTERVVKRIRDLFYGE